VLRVEVEDDVPALEVGERDGLPLGVGQGERGRRLSLFELGHDDSLARVATRVDAHGDGQAPGWATAAPASSATQRSAYVIPSHAQTGVVPQSTSARTAHTPPARTRAART